MNAVTKISLALGLLAGAALVIPESAFARGGGGGGGGSGGGGGGGTGTGGKGGGTGGGSGGGAPGGGGAGKGGGIGGKGGGAPGSPGAGKGNKSNTGNSKGRGDYLLNLQRDDADDARAAFLDDAMLEVIRTRRSAERGE